jgi:hypothetical protein
MRDKETMSKNIKIVIKNSEDFKKSEQTLFESAGFNQMEAKLFENFELQEGAMDFGARLLNGVKGIYDSLKSWKHDKIVAFVKKMGNAYFDLVTKARHKRLISRPQSNKEQAAIKLLLTKEHVDLAVSIFSAIFQLAGGYVVEKFLEMPETLKKIGEILTKIQGGDFIVALKELFGDVEDLMDTIKQAVAFSKQLKKPNVGLAIGDYSEFGGLAEIFNKYIGEPK